MGAQTTAFDMKPRPTLGGLAVVDKALEEGLLFGVGVCRVLWMPLRGDDPVGAVEFASVHDAIGGAANDRQPIGDTVERLMVHAMTLRNQLVPDGLGNS